jgi:hypothetical protein
MAIIITNQLSFQISGVGPICALCTAFGVQRHFEQHIWQPLYEGDDTIFPKNCGALDDEHGEYFHRDISAVEKIYQGQIQFTDVGGLLLKGNRRFSWTCV